MIFDFDYCFDFVGQIFCLLCEYFEGFFEYQLIQLLKVCYLMYIFYCELVDKLVLFCIYFFLFNVFYYLCDYFWVECEVYLEISLLSLCLYFYVDGMQVLEQGDLLCDYYFDLCYLGEISEVDVEWLLQSFWMCMQGSEEKVVVFVLFELEGVVDYFVIKLCYW